MSLTQALQEHKDRRKNDANAIMTMVVKQSKPSPITQQSRLGTDELFMAINPVTKQLLYYEDKAEYSKGCISLDKTLIADNPSVILHNDKQVLFFKSSGEIIWLLFRLPILPSLYIFTQTLKKEDINMLVINLLLLWMWCKSLQILVAFIGIEESCL